MFLARMNYREVEDYLAQNDTVIIPVGSLENHGLHLPLGTDALIPEEIARRVDVRSPLLIAPILNYGATDDLAGFAGTVSLGTEGLTALLRTVCDQLYQYGFRHFMILNGHGGNSAAIQAVGLHLYHKGALLANLNWWLMAGQIDPAWAGGHGGGEETAGVMAVDPRSLRMPCLTMRGRISATRAFRSACPGPSVPSRTTAGWCTPSKGTSPPVPMRSGATGCWMRWRIT